MYREESGPPHRVIELVEQPRPLGEHLQMNPARMPHQRLAIIRHGQAPQTSTILVHGFGAPTPRRFVPSAAFLKGCR